MKLGLLFAAVVLTAPPPGALAQAVECKYDGTQQEMNLCADIEYKTADKALNAAYAKLLASQSEESFKTKLKTAQRSWISYRDNECIFETARSEGGTIHPLEYSVCLTRITKNRTKALKAIAACQENPETCQ